MPEVELEKMSGGTMSRLRNGHACRCALAKSKGSGVKADLDEHDIKELIKAGKKGAKKTIRLSKEAIERNAVKGTGIMEGGRIKIGKIAQKIAKSKPVQGIKKQALKEMGDAAIAGLESQGIPASASKKLVKAIEKKADEATGGNLIKAAKKAHIGRKLKNVAKRSDVQAVKKAGLDMLADAAVAGLTAEGVPPPLAMAGVKALEKQADKATGGKIRMKKPKGFLNHKATSATKDLFGGNVISTVVKGAKKAHVGRKAKNFGITAGREAAGDLGGAAGAAMGGPAGAVVGKVAAQGAYNAAIKASGNGLGAGGSGLYVRGSGVVEGGAIGPAVSGEKLVHFGSGGNLLHGRNPALMSQAGSENFHMHTQLPPFLARRMVD